MVVNVVAVDEEVVVKAEDKAYQKMTQNLIFPLR